MKAFVNGAFVAASEASIGVWDRGLTLGDGVFDTLAIRGGEPCGFPEHWRRLADAARFFSIELPFGSSELRRVVETLIAENGVSEAVVRFTVTRGPGARGYAPKGAGPTGLVVSLSPLPEPPAAKRLRVSTFPVFSEDPLLRYKTLSRAINVLAIQEAQSMGFDDALFLNEHSQFTEATSSNLFFLIDGVWRTPPLACGVLPGVTRAGVLEAGRWLGFPAVEGVVTPADLDRVTAVRLTNSVAGLVAVTEIVGDHTAHRFDKGPPRAST